MSTKKILIITHGMFPIAGQSVTGNGIRAWGLAMGLKTHGHHITYTTHITTAHTIPKQSTVELATYDTDQELHRLIQQQQPDVIIVGYWELIRSLPTDLDIPIVLDLLAPRLLEMEFQSQYDVETEAVDYIKCLNAADYFLCCTQRQKAFHTSWLLMSGINCQQSPIDVIPISVNPVLPQRFITSDKKTTFLYGGVHWPWRNPSYWLQPLLDTLLEKQQGYCQLIVGKYPLSEGKTDDFVVPNQEKYQSVLKLSEFLPYDAMEKLYLQADVGIELGQENCERELSFSFRIVDYLRCGLAVICNDFLEVAALIKRYDAGWVVPNNDETALRKLVQHILANPEELSIKQQNAQKLAQSEFNWYQTIQPLARFCENPHKLAKRDHLLLTLAKKTVHQSIVKALQTQLEDKTQQVVDKDKLVQSILQERDRLLQEKDRLLQEKDKLLASKDDLLANTDKKHHAFLQQTLSERDRLLANKDEVLAQKDTLIAQTLAERDTLLAVKDQQVAEKEQLLAQKDEILQKIITQKDSIIEDKSFDIHILDNTVNHLEARIQVLLQEIQNAQTETFQAHQTLHAKDYIICEKNQALGEAIQERDHCFRDREELLKHRDHLLQQEAVLMHDVHTWQHIAEQRRLKTRLTNLRSKITRQLPWHHESLFYRAVVKRFFLPLVQRWGKNNLAIVTRQDLFPVDHGAAAKIYHTARVLSFHYDEVYLITWEREKFYIFRQGHMHEELYPRLVRHWGFKSYEYLRDKLVEKGVPANESFLFFSKFDTNFKLRVLYVALQKRINHYQAEFPDYVDAWRWARFIFGGKTSVVEHNVEYNRVANTYQISAEAERYLREEEVRQCNQVHHVITVSHSDKDILIKAGVKANKITMIPHGVDLEAFDNEQSDVNVRERYGIAEDDILLIFHGIYSYRPNAEAAEIIGHTILPKLQERGYNLTCLAVGKHPPAESNHPNLIYTGVVDSVAPYTKAADIAIVPLQDGGGTRMKILEYFAASTPVIATGKGAEGIELVQEQDILIRDDMESFVDTVIQLIEDKALREKIGQAGRKVVEKMDWHHIGQRYVELYRA